MKSSDKEPLNVIFLDNHLLVVNKPPGLPTQPRPIGGESLEAVAKAWVKNKYNKKGNVFLTPVHRLDLPVSGLVLFARTSKALSRLQAQMRAKSIKKTYYARIEGKLRKKKGSLRHFLAHRKRYAKSVSKHQGKEATLSYRVMCEGKETSLLEIQLHTGRYHQIRAQFSLLGHPICGDMKYGAKSAYPFERIDLHHGILEFLHPITKEKVTFTKSPAF